MPCGSSTGGGGGGSSNSSGGGGSGSGGGRGITSASGSGSGGACNVAIRGGNQQYHKQCIIQYNRQATFIGARDEHGDLSPVRPR